MANIRHAHKSWKAVHGQALLNSTHETENERASTVRAFVIASADFESSKSNEWKLERRGRAQQTQPATFLAHYLSIPFSLHYWCLKQSSIANNNWEPIERRPRRCSGTSWSRQSIPNQQACACLCFWFVYLCSRLAGMNRKKSTRCAFLITKISFMVVYISIQNSHRDFSRRYAARWSHRLPVPQPILPLKRKPTLETMLSVEHCLQST